MRREFVVFIALVTVVAQAQAKQVSADFVRSVTPLDIGYAFNEAAGMVTFRDFPVVKGEVVTHHEPVTKPPRVKGVPFVRVEGNRLLIGYRTFVDGVRVIRLKNPKATAQRHSTFRKRLRGQRTILGIRANEYREQSLSRMYSSHGQAHQISECIDFGQLAQVPLLGVDTAKYEDAMATVFHNAETANANRLRMPHFKVGETARAVKMNPCIQKLSAAAFPCISPTDDLVKSLKERFPRLSWSTVESGLLEIELSDERL